MERKPGQKAAIFAEKGRRLVRSWETMMLLAETTRPLTAAQINERVHQLEEDDQCCNIQTTREDLKTLQKSGFPVCKVDQDDNEIVEDGETTIGKLKNVRWRLRDPSKMGEFTSPYLRQPSASDIVSLSLCRALLKDEMPSQFPLRQSVDKILEELQLRLNKNLRFGDSVDIDLYDKVRRLGRQYVGKSVLDSEWSTITTAIAKQQVLIADYENRAGEKRKVDIAPLAVWFSEGRSYVLAAGATDKKVRAWRIDRFSDMWVDSKRKPPKISEEEIEETLRTSFHGYISAPIKIHLKVKPEAAYLFREFQYHPTQKVIENDDGSLSVTMECALGWGFEEWVLGFGELVVVEEPYELRKKIGDRVATLMRIYTT
ncbi:MAG: WYL domain-containing protein [Bacteroidales bacterium]|jgi:hypothetical protein|nr:WYL domain-containing protein [Bacteroidales bacterium]